MQKKVIVVLLLIVGSAIFIQSKVPNKQSSKKVILPSVIPSQLPVRKETKSIFVPYWSVGNEMKLGDYDRVFYFGISPNLNGIDHLENGYMTLEKFVPFKTSQSRYYLTLRMIDEKINDEVLININPRVQETIIKETFDLAQKYSFQGVALDLELFSLFQGKITTQINDFVQRFYTEAHERNIAFSFIVYGDVFFRKRPYDIGFIAKHSDEVMVMAYDYHKSRGEPGPNFPLNNGDIYDYDLKLMVDEFLQFVPSEKLTIIFGMYGYDWLVDEKKRPIKPGKALSYNEIKKKFIDSCQWKNCVIKRDEISAETEINYIDEFQNYHIVWFEDMQSTKTKTDYLKEKGISDRAYWGYDYF